MKVCKKCNNQFNEKYSFCPKCGSNYETGEKVKTPTLIDYKKIFIIGGIIVFVIIIIIAIATSNSTASDNSNKTDNNKTNYYNTYDKETNKFSKAQSIIDNMILKNNTLNYKYDGIGIEKEDDKLVGRYVDDDATTSLTATFNLDEQLTNYFVLYKFDDSKSKDDAYNIVTSSIFNLNNEEKQKIREIIDYNSDYDKTVINNYEVQKIGRTNINIKVIDSSKISNMTEDNSNNNTPTEQPKEEKQEKPKKITYKIEYRKLGDYGKLVEYEGENEYFYYFPSGTYDLKLKTKSSWKVNACWVFIDYNTPTQSKYGSVYEEKEKYLFVDINETKTITLTDDVHIWLGEGCTTYELTKKD